jgi:hypothetical protein
MRNKRPVIIISTALILAVGLVLAVCCFWRPTPIEGVYVFRSSKVEETLELRLGGGFSQRIKIGENIYDATGRWSLKAHDLKFRNDFLVRFDICKGKVLKPPLQVSLCSAYWDSWHSRISFSEDYDKEYFPRKTQ